MPYANKDKRAAYMLAWARAHPGRQTERNHKNGTHKPFNENRDCASYLGVYIAERALSRFFDNITRMPFGNPGYDFLCGRGFKIDVKSGCLSKRESRRSGCWNFRINWNKVADYFLCLAFDDRKSLEPQHVWLIPGNIINRRSGVVIPNTITGIAEWSKYEYPLNGVIECCNTIREGSAVKG